MKTILIAIILAVGVLIGMSFVVWQKPNNQNNQELLAATSKSFTTLSSTSSITIRTYPKGHAGGVFDYKLPDLHILSIDDENATATIGGLTQHIVSSTSALLYINSFEGYLE